MMDCLVWWDFIDSFPYSSRKNLFFFSPLKLVCILFPIPNCPSVPNFPFLQLFSYFHYHPLTQYFTFPPPPGLGWCHQELKPRPLAGKRLPCSWPVSQNLWRLCKWKLWPGVNLNRWTASADHEWQARILPVQVTVCTSKESSQNLSSCMPSYERSID